MVRIFRSVLNGFRYAGSTCVPLGTKCITTYVTLKFYCAYPSEPWYVLRSWLKHTSVWALPCQTVSSQDACEGGSNVQHVDEYCYDGYEGVCEISYLNHNVAYIVVSSTVLHEIKLPRINAPCRRVCAVFVYGMTYLVDDKSVSECHGVAKTRMVQTREQQAAAHVCRRQRVDDYPEGCTTTNAEIVSCTHSRWAYSFWKRISA